MKFFTIAAVCMVSYSLPIKNLGGCHGTQFGCCPDDDTACKFQNCSNCLLKLGGCHGTQFGCCPDDDTACKFQNCSNCLPISSM